MQKKSGPGYVRVHRSRVDFSIYDIKFTHTRACSHEVCNSRFSSYERSHVFEALCAHTYVFFYVFFAHRSSVAKNIGFLDIKLRNS